MRCSKCEKELHDCKCVWAIPIVCQRCGEVNPAEIHTCTPKRGWVSLTDEEIYAVENEYLVNSRIPVGCGLYFAKDIGEKLREKNS